MHRMPATLLFAAAAAIGMLNHPVAGDERRPDPERRESAERRPDARPDVRPDVRRDEAGREGEREGARRPQPPFGSGPRPSFGGGPRTQFDPEKMKEFREHLAKHRESMRRPHGDDAAPAKHAHRCPECEKLAAQHRGHGFAHGSHAWHGHRRPGFGSFPSARREHSEMARRETKPRAGERPAGERREAERRPAGPPPQPGIEEVSRKLDRLIEAVEGLSKSLKK